MQTELLPVVHRGTGGRLQDEVTDGLVDAGDGLRLDPAHADRLAEAGLASFDALMNLNRGDVCRAFGVRLTVRLEIGGRTFYLKRHTDIAERDGWLPWQRPAITDARREYDNLQLLRRAGFSVARVAALGERGRLSFLLLEEIPDAEPADDRIARLYPVPTPGERLGEKRHLLRRIGALTRRLHDLGFNHRDMYLCHVFVGRTPDAAGELPLHLIDLQRLQHRVGGAPRRWRVKDVAQLIYSAREDLLSDGDRRSLLAGYLGDDESAFGKPFLRSVLRKTESIRRHDAKYAAPKPEPESAG